MNLNEDSTVFWNKTSLPSQSPSFHPFSLRHSLLPAPYSPSRHSSCADRQILPETSCTETRGGGGCRVWMECVVCVHVSGWECADMPTREMEKTDWLPNWASSRSGVCHVITRTQETASVLFSTQTPIPCCN